MTAKTDEFEAHARAVLRDDPGLVDSLLALRRDVQHEGNEAWSKSKSPTAAELNTANRRMIGRAASLLGPSRFQRVFGFAPTAKFDLVDPRIMRSEARREAAPGVRPMSKARLIENIERNTHLARRDVKGVLEMLTVVGHKELKRTGVFLVPGFAKFVVVKKPAVKARKGTNPFTGEEMMFKAKPSRKILRVRPVKTARDAV